MTKFDVSKYSRFSDLNLHDFDDLKYSVYVLDLKWNYRYVNKFVKDNLGEKGNDLLGKTMWDVFPILNSDPSFNLIKHSSEKGIPVNTITISPINSQRLHIIGYPLNDCYLFFSSILPKKEDLIDELRRELEKKN